MILLPSSTNIRRWLAWGAGCLALALGCGGEEFSSAPAGSSGSGGGGGGGSGGAGGGEMTSGGSEAEGGEGGSGGSGNCSCDAGQYCRAGSCRDCSDFSVLQFGEPEELPALSGAEPDPSFPRTGGPGNSLFYSSGHPSSGHIHFSSDFTSEPGQHVSGMSSPPEFGPLYIENGGGLDFNLLFTRVPQNAPSVIVTADWDPAARTFSGATLAPGAVNDPASADYSVAFAPGTTRLWWMSDRDGEPALYTTLLGDVQSPEQVSVEIPASATTSCAAAYPDLTPWVTRDGALMLLSAEAVDEQCTADGTTDLYAVPLSGDGMPITTAVALDDLNLPGSDETTPSLSPDACWLYFASNSGGDFAVYRAPRR